MAAVVEDSSTRTPLIFVLSPGVVGFYTKTNKFHTHKLLGFDALSNLWTVLFFRRFILPHPCLKGLLSTSLYRVTTIHHVNWFVEIFPIDWYLKTDICDVTKDLLPGKLCERRQWLCCTESVLDMRIQMPLIDYVSSHVFLTSLSSRLLVCLSTGFVCCCPCWMLFKGGDRKEKICPMLSCDVQYRTCRIRPVHCYSLLRTLGCPIVSMLSHWVKARHL